MTQILTESFCERCGTRYTFETVAPRKSGVTSLKVLSKGIRNFVMSDSTTLEDAFADAKSDVERTASTQQLEAFHQTFNFCLDCRQYTCGNCWNDVENRCLSCKPDLSREPLPAPFAALEPLAAVAPEPAVPEPQSEDRAALLAAMAWPETDLRPRSGVAPAAEARPGPQAPPALEAPPAATEPEPEPVAPSSAPTALVAEGEPAAGPAAVEPEPAAATSDEGRAAVAAAATASLLLRFRPGQDLDAEIAAYEQARVPEAGREPITIEIAATPEAIEAEAVAEPEPVAADAEPEAVADAAVAGGVEAVEAESEPIAAEAEPGAVAAVAEPEAIAAEAEAIAAEAVEVAEPAAAAVAEPEAVTAEPEAVQIVEAMADEPVGIEAGGATAEAARQPEAPVTSEPTAAPVDRISQPVWTSTPPVEPAAPVAPPAAPQWPSQPTTEGPRWPTTTAFLPGTDPTAARARDAMWAASAAEVVQPPSAAKVAGVRSCGSCGLQLSATARFCRRCGTSQG